MLEFKRRTLNIKFEGSECEINFPTALQLDGYREATKDDQSLEATLKFLEDLGLSRDIGDQLEVDHLSQLVTELSKVKKH